MVSKDDERSSLVDDIACVVGAEILEGLRRPGSDLNSVELSRRFRTSRTPTREAVVILEKEGLVEILPRRRPRVADLSIAEIREIYRVRAAMLGLIATEVTALATDAEIADYAAALKGNRYYPDPENPGLIAELRKRGYNARALVGGITAWHAIGGATVPLDMSTYEEKTT